MRPDAGAALLDIAHAARRLIALTSGVSLETFLADETLREAVQYRLIIAGEAVKRLPAEFRERHSSVRWAAIAGLRDVLVHSYERVDQVEVWNIAVRNVPELLRYIEPLLPVE